MSRTSGGGNKRKKDKQLERAESPDLPAGRGAGSDPGSYTGDDDGDDGQGASIDS